MILYLYRRQGVNNPEEQKSSRNRKAVFTLIYSKKFHKNCFQLCDFMLKNFLGVTFIAYGHKVGINIIAVFKYLFQK